MSQRAIITYRKNSDNTERKIVFINGSVANPSVEQEVSDNLDDFEAVFIRRSGEPSRNLVFVPET